MPTTSESETTRQLSLAVRHDVPTLTQLPNIVSEQQLGKRGTEDVPVVTPSAKKKPRNTSTGKTPGSTSVAKQSKRKVAEIKVTDDGNKALEELEESVNWSTHETNILLEELLGADSELYKELGSNARYAYRKVSMLV